MRFDKEDVYFLGEVFFLFGAS